MHSEHVFQMEIDTKKSFPFPRFSIISNTRNSAVSSIKMKNNLLSSSFIDLNTLEVPSSRM